MNPGVYGPLDSATNFYTGLPINKQRVSKLKELQSLFHAAAALGESSIDLMDSASDFGQHDARRGGTVHDLRKDRRYTQVGPGPR